MKNLNYVRIFTHTIMDKNRRVDKLTHALASGHGTANIGKTLQQFDVIEDRIAELFGITGEVDPGVGEDFLEFP